MVYQNRKLYIELNFIDLKSTIDFPFFFSLLAFLNSHYFLRLKISYIGLHLKLKNLRVSNSLQKIFKIRVILTIVSLKYFFICFQIYFYNLHEKKLKSTLPILVLIADFLLEIFTTNLF